MPTATDQLRLLYDLNRRLTTFDDLDELLRYATQRTREMFDAEGCALLLHARERHELYFPVASQRASGREAAESLAEVRFPADRGIAGWVLAHDQVAMVPDVRQDTRFYPEVDKATHTTTRAVMCAPLRSRSGNIGVIEVVNPIDGSLTDDNLEFLESLAGDIAVAHEKAELYARLRGEVIGLRWLCRVAGFGLLATGVLVSLGAAFAHMAMALPVRDLPARPGMVAGLAGMVAGVLLIGAARERRPPRPSLGQA